MRDIRLATVPVALAACAGVGLFAFVQIAEEVGEGAFEQIDEALLLMFRDPADLSRPIGPEWLKEAMIEVTALGGYPLLVVIVSAVIGFLLVSRHYGPALFTVLSIVSGTMASHALKAFYDRPRPDIAEQLVNVYTPSFPSGHATMSAVVYLTLAALIVRLVDRPAVRIYVLVVAVLLAVAIGVSRVYLGVHWPSDVAAGWSLGIAWASAAWLAATALRAWRDRNGGN